MQAIAKKLFLGSVLLGAILVLGLVITLGLFEDRIGRKVLDAVNQQLESPLQTTGFDLSLLSSFPYVSVRMDDVRVQGTADEPLLQADYFYFNLSLSKLLNRHILIKAIRIEDGEVFILNDRTGKSNYTIWKVGTTSTPGPKVSFSIDLKKATLENIIYNYIDEKIALSAQGRIDQAEFSGKFANRQFDLSSFAEIESDYLQLKNDLYLSDKALVYDTDMFVDLDSQRYEIQTFNLGLAGNVLTLEGVLTKTEQGLDCALTAELEDAKVTDLLDIMPGDSTARIWQWLEEGELNARAELNGTWSKTQKPGLTASWDLNNARLTIPDTDITLKRIELDGALAYELTDDKPGLLKLTDISARFKREDLTANCTIIDFRDPQIDLTFDGTLPVPLLQPYLPKDWPVQEIGGSVDIENLYFQGPVNKLGTVGFSHKADLNLDEVAFRFKDGTIGIEDGLINIQDNSITVDGLEIEAPGTRGELNGSILNGLAFLQPDSTLDEVPKLKAHAVLEGSELDVDALIALFASPPKTSQQVSDTAPSDPETRKFTQTVDAQIDIRFDKVNYRQAHGTDLDASMRLINRFMEMHADVSTMEGHLKWDGYMDFDEQFTMHAIVDLSDIDVEKCFRDCENFGQDFITDDHISGSLDANVLFEAKWDEQGNFLQDDLHVLSNLVINDGELQDFKMLYDFADYIKIQDLRNIKFANMRNWLEIKDRKVYIPVTFIQSNAANLSVHGIHSFDQEVDYYLKVNAGQVFFNKFKKYNPDNEPLKARRKGFFNLYYHLYGPVNDIQYINNKRRVKNEFERSEALKREVREKLEMAFGEGMLLHEPEDWEDEIPEYTDEVPGEPVYLDNF